MNWGDSNLNLSFFWASRPRRFYFWVAHLPQCCSLFTCSSFAGDGQDFHQDHSRFTRGFKKANKPLDNYRNMYGQRNHHQELPYQPRLIRHWTSQSCVSQRYQSGSHIRKARTTTVRITVQWWWFERHAWGQHGGSGKIPSLQLKPLRRYMGVNGISLGAPPSPGDERPRPRPMLQKRK